jgi:hypothetical protein
MTDDDVTAQLDAITARLDDVERRLTVTDAVIRAETANLDSAISDVSCDWEAANERRRREIEALRTTLARQEDDMRYELDRLRRELDSRLRRW